MDEAETLIQDQVTDGNLILNFLGNADLTGGERKSLAVWRSRRELLKEYWQSFRDRHRKLQFYSEDLKDKPYFKKNQFLKVETSYIETLATLSESVDRESTPAAQAPAGRSYASLSLPKIPLPTFDGNQQSWDTFKELFRARVVDDGDIPPAVKLQHLLTSLQGDAARRFGNLQLTSANFQVAWETLTRRYDNRRIRLSTHLSRLISAPAVNTKVTGEITRLLDTFEESIRALRGLEQPVNHWDAWFVQLVVSKLDFGTRSDWEKHREGDDNFSTYQQLTNFLENRARTQDAAKASSSSPQPVSKSSNSANSKKSNVSAHATSAGARGSSTCSQCSGESHQLSKCPKFLQMNVTQRRQLMNSLQDNCYNCLGFGHRYDRCSSKFKCRTCGALHHTLLHQEKSSNSSRPRGAPQQSQQQQSPQTQQQQSPQTQQQQSPQTQQQQSSQTQQTSSSNVTVNTVCVGGRVLMATALVVLDSGHSKMTVRALLDPAADESFISSHVAQALQLKRSSVTTSLTVVGGETATPPRSEVAVTIKSLLDHNFSFNFSALVLKKLTNYLPSEQVQYHDWPHIQGLQLADPEFYKPGRIDCILSAEIWAVAQLGGLQKGPYPSPVAQNTVFGWVLIGPVRSSTCCQSRVSCNVIQRDSSLNHLMQKFWEVEESPKSTLLTPEEAECEAHFLATHQRDASGRFVLRLPFNQTPELPGSLEIAKSRFFACEKRLEKDTQSRLSYNDFLHEYENLGHMEPIPDCELHRENCCYIPHHGVFRAESGKLRVVFNASQPAKNGKSLNDYLYPGPKLQSELLSVLTRWRFFRYVFTADIVKMFRQFRIHPEDADWLRILWRPSVDQPLQSYRLTTVTYGTASAPYQAIRCLKQLAADEQHRFPMGASILQHHSYVDDNLGGDHDIASTIQARDQLTQILASAGMQLDKWSANDPRILEGVMSSSDAEHVFEEAVSTLGLKWKPQQDCFQFKVTTKPASSTVTKRTMLSEIASLFDPLGWLSPIIIKAKVYIQELWIRQNDWDEPVDDDIREAWASFKEQLPDIENISIPRWVFTTRTSTWELHGFSDASERAYAAVIYLVTYDENTYQSSLILAKTKVAPVKRLSIPRLELCGAQLLSKIINFTRQQLLDQPIRVLCWSDSQVVLAWLKGHPTRWNTFVGNKVSEILTNVPDANWNHVDTHNNPADIASRGATPLQLQQSTLWWNGPKWLQQGPDFWPRTTVPDTTDCEAKTNTTIFRSAIQDSSLHDWCSRFSSLGKLTRYFSLLFRWKHNALSKSDAEKLSTPSVQNFSQALTAIIRVTQRHHFKDDIEAIARHGAVGASSHLKDLKPFISPDNLLRVGGRVQELAGSYDEKHPPIIPKGSHLAKLLINDAHIRTLHGGAQLTQSTLRRHYWIIHDRSQIRHTIKHCIKCLRYQGRPQQQLMANLPAVRLQPSRPFTSTGVDYAGPFNIRASRLRGYASVKGYVSIFVCMVTRAVHIEVVSDYSSKAFLAAFRRFVSRRGMCRTMYSDQGTTFKGADTEIQKLFAANSNFIKEVTTAIKAEGVEWSFIPPKAPHHGGLWESKVKSFKHHFRRVAGEIKLTFEELSTLATQIEACINSRPLSPLTSDANDINALTPGHFLIGGPIQILPAPYSPLEESTKTPTERWLLIQKILGDFWRRWRVEVLHELQRRSKWLEPHRNLQINDIVIIMDDLCPPAQWSLGRVIQCHPGSDGLTRVVTLRTSTTVLRRPVTKLILLPTNNEATTLLTAVQYQGQVPSRRAEGF